MFRKPPVLYAIIAAAALVAGLLVYLLDRQPEHVYFLSHGLTATGAPHALFGVAGNHLPAFLHVYAFMLLTVAVAGSTNSQLIRIGAAWFVIVSLFEFGQHPAVSPLVAASLPAWLMSIPVLDNTAAYFLGGTFDPLDFLAIAMGTVAAVLTVALTRNSATHAPLNGRRYGAFRRLALGGTSLIGILAIIGSGGGDGDVILGSGGDNSRLYVSGNNSDALLVYEDANSVSGSTAASRTVTAATLNEPRGIAVDMARNQIYVANAAGNSILVFSDASTMTGDIPPARTISGGSLNGPTGLFLDMFNDRLYVTSPTNNSILVFDSASTKNGNVAPSRVLTGTTTTLNAPSGVLVDVTRDKLYVINGGADSILVFDDAASVSGDRAPSRTISGVSTTLNGPSGGALDVLQDRLYVANTGSDSVLVFNNIGASATSGDIAPARTLNATALNLPRDLYLDLAGDRLYVANTGGDSVLVFDDAGAVIGTAAPDRILTLAAGTAPYGVFVDATPVVAGSVADLDGEVDSNGVATSVGGAPKVGDVESFPTSTAYRQFYSFNLANIPSGTVISAATLRLNQTSITNSPYDGSLGSVVVDHVNYGPVLDATAYATPTLANAGTLSSDASTGYKSLNITSRVQSDLNNGWLNSQYRLRFSLSDANLDFGDDYVQFTDFEDSCCAANRPPQLVITIQP